MRIPGFGFSVKLKELKDGKVLWMVGYYRKELSSGVCKSRKEAEVEASKALVEHQMQAGALSEDRSKWRGQLRYMLKSRPYMVAAVCESLMMGAPEKRIWEEAEESEKAWQSKDKTNARKEISKHHLATKPAQAAEKVFRALVGAGLVKIDTEGEYDAKRAVRWAQETFGAHHFGG